MARTERKRSDDIDDLFSTFDEEFEEMRARVDQMIEQMLNGQLGSGEETNSYEVSVWVGPDGKPHVQEFGKEGGQVPVEKKRGSSREPLTDVIEEKDKVRVIVELPGVEKNDIDVSAEDAWLNISVDSDSKKFSKHIELPCRIKSKSVSASYKNGVLEITMDRSSPKRRRKKTIVQ